MSPLSSISSLLPLNGLNAAADATPRVSPDMQSGLAAEVSKAATPGAGGTDSFANVLKSFVEEVNAKQGAASEAVSALQSGQNVPLHQAVIAMEEANVSFQLMVEVRNKLLESYQEIMRLQV